MCHRLNKCNPVNRPVAKIPQCTSPVSHNVPFCNRNVHVHISVTKWCIVGYVSNALWEMGLLDHLGRDSDRIKTHGLSVNLFR